MREKFTVTVDCGTAENLRAVSKMTRLSISRLMEEAIEDLMFKYDLPKLIKEFEEKEKQREEIRKIIKNTTK